MDPITYNHYILSKIVTDIGDVRVIPRTNPCIMFAIPPAAMNILNMAVMQNLHWLKGTFQRNAT
jgi:hypothetical protein